MKTYYAYFKQEYKFHIQNILYTKSINLMR